ncbi:MAG: hypothetical protein E7578_01505 [Ruminococcaceae bacterium]|nr:hypothetical protein [Oscillospiraceae bacterium]
MPQRSKILIVTGVLLVLVSLVLLVGWRITANTAKDRAEDIVDSLEKLLPKRSTGITAEYSDMNMPVLELDGHDLVAIIEIPELKVSLPVGSVWESSGIASYPRRFTGTVYDGSLVIGGADQKGQFDFIGKTDIGMSVVVTDMTGAEFSYTVSRVDRSASADAEVICSDDPGLTLFARDAYSMEYIIVRCSPCK